MVEEEVEVLLLLLVELLPVAEVGAGTVVA